MLKIQGPAFIALQWEDLDAAKQFYHYILGLPLAKQQPPEAILFDTKPIHFAIRKPLIDLSLTKYRGHGISLWLKAEDSQAILEKLEQHKVEIVQGMAPSPFGQTLTFRDPEGYLITIQDG